MKNEINKNRAYLEVLKKLRKIISVDYDDGGWLPPVRKMCTHLGISDLTYRKAINLLIIDGTIKSYPRKGLYVTPEELRLSKIGFIVGNGGESPFWESAELITKSLNRILEEEYCVHQLNASPIDTLPQKILLHGVRGLIWFVGEKNAIPIINAIQSENILPLVVIPLRDFSKDCNMNESCANVISLDYRQLGQERAKFFIERGHKSVAYIGSFWFSEFSGFADCLKQADIKFSLEHCLNNNDSVENNLLKLITEKNITGIVSEGGDHVESLFRLLSKIPFNKQPELLIRHHHSLRIIYKKYPNVKLTGIGDINDTRGTLAAEMLCSYLKTGKKLSSIQVPAYYISQNIEKLLLKNK